jgi:hypothetical protein
MARLRILTDDELPQETAAQVKKIEAKGGDATVQRILAYRPELFTSYFSFYYAGHENGVVDATLKELVRLKIARLNDCPT